MTQVEHPEFYKQLMDNLYDGVYFLDTQRRITYWNRGAERLTGYQAGEVVGRCCADNILMHVDTDGASLCQNACLATMTLKDGKRREAQVFLHHKDGHRVPVRMRIAPVSEPGGRIVGALQVFSNAAPNKALAERLEQLQKLAFFDALTGIGNRRYAETTLETRMAELNRYGWRFGILMVDIDNFKAFNDRHGHGVGDRVLRMVANTLMHSLRTFDAVARWGGEEFLCVLANVDREQCEQTAERLRRLVEESGLVEGGRPLRVTVSVGAALARPGDTEEAVIKRADDMLYRSKGAGRNHVVMSAPE